jgi:hypothetical protein
LAGLFRETDDLFQIAAQLISGFLSLQKSNTRTPKPPFPAHVHASQSIGRLAIETRDSLKLLSKQFV